VAGKVRFLTCMLTGWLAAVSAPAQTARPAPTMQSGIDGILAALRTHSVVGLGDVHNLAQEEDFLAALVRDPRFAADVRDVVVEFGSAQTQSTLDRYANGENVPYAELRKIWEDRAGATPVGVRLGYINFFAQVRAVNLGLPADKRIRVWLGDPPIEWSQVRTKADWLPILRQREAHAAALIEREILSKGRKALLIYGAVHFYGNPDSSLPNLGPLLTEKHPGALFIVTPYAGFNEKACSVAFEKYSAAWPVPSFVSPVRGTSLEDALHKPDCHMAPAGGPAWQEGQFSGGAGDALLYLGPAHALLLSPLQPDIYVDEAYRAEMSRRYEVIIGKPLSASTVDRNPAAPLPFRP
jgi:hypothetical protein